MDCRYVVCCITDWRDPCLQSGTIIFIAVGGRPVVTVCRSIQLQLSTLQHVPRLTNCADRWDSRVVFTVLTVQSASAVKRLSQTKEFSSCVSHIGKRI